MKKRYQVPTNNQILKKGLLNLFEFRGWRKKQSLCKIAINLEEVKPETFTGQYKRNGQENDLFFYFKDLKLIGALEGSKNLSLINDSIYNEITKNRKHLTANADLILRVPAEQRNYYNIYKKPIETLTLHERLKKYKLSKRKNITKEQVEKRIQNAISLINKNLFSTEIKWNDFGRQDGLQTLYNFIQYAEDIIYFDEEVSKKVFFSDKRRLELLEYIEKIENNLI